MSARDARGAGACISLQRVCRARIGKEQHSEFKACSFGRYFRVLEFALALLLLQLRLYHVSMSGLAGLLALAGQLGEIHRLLMGALGNREFVIGCH